RGASTNQWSTGATNTSIIVSPTVTTTYSVQGYPIADGSANFTVYVKPQITFTISSTNGTNPSICKGASVNLNVAAPGSENGITYLWNPGGHSGSFYKVSPATTTTY